MIIVRLIGGLGNQMFQYAAGRRLACHHNTYLLLDISGFSSYSLRVYELSIFNIQANIASDELLKEVPFLNKQGLQLKINNFLKRKSVFQYIKEPSPEFNKKILSLPDHVYLDGYWQSEKYFGDISEIIKKEFTFFSPPPTRNQKIIEKIKGCNSVSVHVRRGDYVNNPETCSVHYICDEKYYQTAFTKLKDLAKDPEFFIFSDDPEWAQKNVVPDAPVTYITNNPSNRSYEDMWLMTQCRHHIIANSSFSWWGAWLGKKTGQIVLAPKRWFALETLSSKDKCPDSWIKI